MENLYREERLKCSRLIGLIEAGLQRGRSPGNGWYFQDVYPDRDKAYPWTVWVMTGSKEDQRKDDGMPHMPTSLLSYIANNSQNGQREWKCFNSPGGYIWIEEPNAQ